MLGPSERTFDKDFCSTLVSNSNVMLNGQEFPFCDLRIRDAIKHLKKSREGGEKVKYENSKVEKQMVDAFFFKGSKFRRVFLLSVSLESLNALVLSLRK